MMKPLTIVVPYSPEPAFEKALFFLKKSDLVERLVIIGQEPLRLKIPGCRVLAAGPLSSQETLSLILGDVETKSVLLLPGFQQVSIDPEALEKFLERAVSTNAGLVYSDYYDEGKDGKTFHPLCDYQLGSVRDDFDFGAMLLFSVAAVRETLRKYGVVSGMKFAGLYDVRLKVSIDHPVHHLQEPLYSIIRNAGAIQELPPQEEVFAYVDPRNEAAQDEMEIVFTEYLKKIGAYLPPDHFKEVEEGTELFQAEASIIIPVLNRKETIARAVKSALSQETDFPFNVIIVDNHSSDGTTAILCDLARQYSSLKHIIPRRTDLGIGGCWNEALRDEVCGRYAVQLDSDDLYSNNNTLQKIVNLLRQSNDAMVIGSYTVVDSRLQEIPPGLVDHQEWTDENGHNNALRVNGLGAPRAFQTSLMRRIGFLNVSYGEDYAAALRISREYRIGRIYESLYLCRRWSGNTDAALSVGEANRNNIFKDTIRTDEILARQKMNQGG
jgi:Glycosyl transferase family 2